MSTSPITRYHHRCYSKLLHHVAIYAPCFLIITQLAIIPVDSQTCTDLGQLCGANSNCCRGCCQNFRCMDQSYCTTDLGVGVGGIGLGTGTACQSFYCPPGQMCYQSQICTPGTACVPQPMCRPYSAGYGQYGGGYYWRNAAPKSANPVYGSIVTSALAGIWLNLFG